MKFSLIIHLVKQDLIDRYSGSVLGGLWSFIMPLVNIIIFVLIFSKIMSAKLGVLNGGFMEYGYSIYLVSGILAWNSFSILLLRITNIFKEKSGLITKVHMNLLYLPLYIVISESIIYFISMSFFIGFLLMIGYPITKYWLLIPFIYFLQSTFAYALGLFLATLSVFIKDITELIKVIVQLWFWFTPLVYVMNILPEKLQYWFKFNPMYYIISAYRDIIIEFKMPDIYALGVFFISTFFLVLLSSYIFKKLEKDLRDFM